MPVQISADETLMVEDAAESKILVNIFKLPFDFEVVFERPCRIWKMKSDTAA